MVAQNHIVSAGIEVGNIQPSRSGTGRTRLVIASYNIRYGVGQFLISTGLLRKAGFNLPRRRTEIVRGNVQSAARAFKDGSILPPVDILALQEADKATARAGKHHIARELGEAMGMSWLHVPAGIPRGVAPKPRQWWLDFEEQIELFDQGDTGVAFLSALALEDVTRIDLPWQECPWRPRLAVGATVNLGPSSLRILNAHIDPHSGPGGQIEQLDAVLQHLREPEEPALVLGDFNTLSKRKCIETRRLLESRGFTTPFPTGTATWRGAGIRLHADWVFIRGVKVLRWGVARALRVSDHWPIWVEVSLEN